MRIINLFAKSVLGVSVCSLSGGVMAETASHAAHSGASMLATVVVSDSASHQSVISLPESQPHDHRQEHGAQIYAVTTVDTQWQLNESGEGALQSELQTRIGTDENKLFLKIHRTKHESQPTEYDAKLLYSRMLSDFWDVQAGVRYRNQTAELVQQTDTEESLDVVLGLHGLAPYFFETDAHVYVGHDHYAAVELETTRDLLLTQKWIAQPYLDVKLQISDDTRYAQKTGLSHVAAGLELRYEVNKNIMPYVDVGYAYHKGNQHTAWQTSTPSEQGWLYAAGLRFRF
ncbi:copper resistance protein B [Acinetobacter towneri]|uniref:copper resistance protein B n=1 Tax=Acinetobacter towneri TaxID=202956 RepID=UPI001443F1F8|nr:copper resistance protein B [Acinetobacter towneri]